MTKILKKTELTEIRDAINDFIDKSITRKLSLVSGGKLTQGESDQIADFENALQEVTKQFNSLILLSVVADIESPGAKIITATNNLKDALAELESLNDFLGIIASVITIGTKIITAFTTGNPFAIAGILEDIEVFL